MNRSIIAGLVLFGIATIIFFAEDPLRKTGLDKIAAVMRTSIAFFAIVLIIIGCIQR